MGVLGDRDDLLLDREGELGAMREALARAARGHGITIVVEGPAGTGKSALVRRAHGLAQEAGLSILRAAGGELEHDFAFGVIRQLFEPTLASLAGQRRAELLTGAAAPAAWVLGLAEAGTGVHAAGYAALHAIYWLTARLAVQTPRLVIVDDAHWADWSSLRALDYITRRIADLPVALIVAFRPDEPGAPADVLDSVRSGAELTISLSPLSPQSVARLVHERFPEADDEMCQASHAASAGNPLYLQELLRALAGSDAVPGAEQIRQASVRSLGDRILRRAARVDEQAPVLTRAMAVLADGTRLELAAELAGLTRERTGQIANGLRRIEILDSEDPLSFVHPLIRRSVYDATPDHERHSMHRDAARLLASRGAAAELVAAHLRVLAPAGDGAAAETFMVAAERALERAAPDEAVPWIERALAEGAAEPSRIHILTRLGTAKAIQRDPAALGHLQEAHALADDPALRGRLAVLLAEILSHAGLWDQTMIMIDSAERDLTASDTELAGDVAAIRATGTLFDPARVADFDARRESYVALARGDSWGAHALAALLAAEAARRGQPAEARAFAEQALRGGRLLAERGAGGWTPPLVLAALIETDALEQADAAIVEVETAARASGAVVARLSAVAYRAWALARRGDLAAAETDLLLAMELVNDSGLLMGLTTASYLMLDVLLERDGLDDIISVIERVELGGDFLRTVSGAMLLEVWAALRLRRGERELAIAHLRAAGDTYASLRFGPLVSAWRSSLALALPADDRTEARALARDELDLARATGLPRPEGIALRALGILERGQAGIELLEQSVAVLETSPARLERARSLIELGAALRRANRRADARQPLASGLELAHACGAERLVTHAQQELLAAGGRRRRIATTGRDALTASELRIVQLAAAGATNLEIAQQLYISLKTVETHLYRAYGKLGLAGSGSRARLAAVLAEPV